MAFIIDTRDEIYDQMAAMEKAVAEAHAIKYPNGCPATCEACCKRLNIARAECFVCGNKAVPVRDSKLQEHDRKVGARTGYNARAQRCDGSGRKPAFTPPRRP